MPMKPGAYLSLIAVFFSLSCSQFTGKAGNVICQLDLQLADIEMLGTHHSPWSKSRRGHAAARQSVCW